jgi:hypothetical protein
MAQMVIRVQGEKIKALEVAYDGLLVSIEAVFHITIIALPTNPPFLPA